MHQLVSKSPVSNTRRTKLYKFEELGREREGEVKGWVRLGRFANRDRRTTRTRMPIPTPSAAATVKKNN